MLVDKIFISGNKKTVGSECYTSIGIKICVRMIDKYILLYIFK
jgi:hypothetical protein